MLTLWHSQLGATAVPREDLYREVGRRLLVLREREGLSQKYLADSLGVAESTYSRYEAGLRKVPLPDLRHLARLLGVTTDQLLGVEPLPPPRQRAPGDILRELEAAIRREVELGPVKVYPAGGTVSAGAGAPGEGEPVYYIPRPGERAHTFVWVEVVGACMEPRVHEGDTVIVDTEASPREGDIVVALHDGRKLVKQLERRGERMYLVALQGQSPIEVDESTRILGVVREARYVP